MAGGGIGVVEGRGEGGHDSKIVRRLRERW